MSRAIPAIFDSGVFRPLETVELADGTPVEVIPLIPENSSLAPENVIIDTWPSGYFQQTAGVLAGEEFERPTQGDLPTREAW